MMALGAVEGSVLAGDTEDYRCKVLWAAVIRKAMSDWALYRDSQDLKQRRRFLDANSWIFGPSDPQELTSFESLCAVLGLPVGEVRRKIREVGSGEVRALRNMNTGYDD